MGVQAEPGLMPGQGRLPVGVQALAPCGRWVLAPGRWPPGTPSGPRALQADPQRCSCWQPLGGPDSPATGGALAPPTLQGRGQG